MRWLQHVCWCGLTLSWVQVVINLLLQRIATADGGGGMHAGFAVCTDEAGCSTATDVGSSSVSTAAVLAFIAATGLATRCCCAAAAPVLLGPPAHPYCLL
jgi:hypothetical protein